VRVIDWDNPKANDFLLVSQMTITGPFYTCRPDLIGFVKFDDAVEALIAPDVVRKDFLAHERLVSVLYRAVKPNPVVITFTARVACLAEIALRIRARLNPNPTDISAIMSRVAETLDASITDVEMPTKTGPVIDLSQIDFKALRKRFVASRHKNTDLEQLKAAIRAQLNRLIQLNPTRADFLKKFEELVESYNAGSRNIEEMLKELIKFAGAMSEEQQRHIREHLSEEELVVFDLLTRPGPELNGEERTEVKKVTKQLLDRLKTLIALDWRRQTQARAHVVMAIQDTLDKGLPRVYSPELYQQKCGVVFEHFYESYPDKDFNIYAQAV